jgi:hypothetical protein
VNTNAPKKVAKNRGLMIDKPHHCHHRFDLAGTGIVLEGRRLWAVQNTNQVTRIRLRPHLTAGVVERIITSDLFQVPATAARFGSRLAVVNAKFDTGIPPTADQYEVVLVRG